MASFTQEEQAMMEQLRKKYAGGGNGASVLDVAETSSCTKITTYSSTVAPERPSSARKPTSLDYGLDVTPCQLCQGTGTQHENYNHRVMERCCTHCEGQGVMMYKDGALVKEPSMPSDQPAGGRPEKPAWAQTPREKIDSLKHQIESIDSKLKEYQKEKEALINDSHADGAEEQQLKDDVIRQLDLQISRLEGSKERRVQQLSQLTRPTTIDDIIENEGV